MVETISLEIDKCKVSKGAEIRNRYNQVSHLTKDTSLKHGFGIRGICFI